MTSIPGLANFPCPPPLVAQVSSRGNGLKAEGLGVGLRKRLLKPDSQPCQLLNHYPYCSAEHKGRPAGQEIGFGKGSLSLAPGPIDFKIIAQLKGRQGEVGGGQHCSLSFAPNA